MATIQSIFDRLAELEGKTKLYQALKARVALMLDDADPSYPLPIGVSYEQGLSVMKELGETQKALEQQRAELLAVELGEIVLPDHDAEVFPFPVDELAQS